MSGQFRLLSQRRFGGLFFTQFFGAFNDNLFKSALSLIFVYSGLIAANLTDVFVNAAAGLFILPFFLFSATAGQIADKYEKSRLIRIIKIGEIAIALLGGIAVYFQNVYAMLTVLFLLGVQSTFFGPLKYSILPQHLDDTELVGGNAQIEMGTFVAILLGTLAGGVIAAIDNVTGWLTVLVIAIAVIGYLAARFIPVAPAPAESAGLRVGFNPIRETMPLIRLARENHAVFLSILGISWFWLLGSAFLAQIPNLTKLHLYGGTTVVTLILSVFTIAIALGSLACERLSGNRVEIGLVPMGAFGMSVAGIDLYFAISALEPAAIREWTEFFGAPGTTRMLIDMALIGFFGGMFIVPLYAFVQSRTPEHRRARVIAVTNIINALFMVGAALAAIVMIGLLDMSIPDFLLTVVLMNVAVSVFVFYQVPEFAMRFLVWILSHTMYRVRHEGLENVPEEGAAVIVCNHVTYVDALLLAGAVRRPIRFIMFKPIYDIPVLNFVFRTSRTIPIHSKREDPQTYARAFEEIEAALEAGDLLCIFPEGALTKDGEVAEFRAGIERILSTTPVPVIPMALRGLWGSFFSHQDGAFKSPKRFWSRVQVVAGRALAPAEATAARLRDRVMELRGSAA